MAHATNCMKHSMKGEAHRRAAVVTLSLIKPSSTSLYNRLLCTFGSHLRLDLQHTPQGPNDQEAHPEKLERRQADRYA